LICRRFDPGRFEVSEIVEALLLTFGYGRAFLVVDSLIAVLLRLVLLFEVSRAKIG
jgi:hypothetical protein